MHRNDTERAARFLVERRGVEQAKQWAAERALATADAEDRAEWLRILQAIIDLSPSPGADTPLN
jgi:hypothetical protein